MIRLFRVDLHDVNAKAPEHRIRHLLTLQSEPADAVREAHQRFPRAAVFEVEEIPAQTAAALMPLVRKVYRP